MRALDWFDADALNAEKRRQMCSQFIFENVFYRFSSCVVADLTSIHLARLAMFSLMMVMAGER
jgi:hypothetical protein